MGRSREINQRWYEKHRDEQKQRASDNRRRYQKRYSLLMKKLKSAPCLDCKQVYPPYVMDFDHRDPKSKLANVSRMREWSEYRLRQEIAKCDLVCANCHREREHSRRGRKHKAQVS